LTILAINQRNSETYFKQNNIDLLVIDEAQNIPDIGKKLKLMVDEIEGLSKTGSLWESYLISERIKQNHFHGMHKEFYFWRNYSGSEIDLIECSSDQINAFEFKWGEKSPKIPPTFKTNYPDVSYTVINRSNYLDFIC